MFTNIAGKLKGLAVVQTIIFVVFGIIIISKGWIRSRI